MLGHVGKAEDDTAGRLDGGDDRMALGGYAIRVHRRAFRAAQTSHRLIVLDEDWQAEERPRSAAGARKGCGALARTLLAQGGDGIDLAIRRFDALHRRVDEHLRRHTARLQILQ